MCRGETRGDDESAYIRTARQNHSVGVLADHAWVRIRIAARAEIVEEAEAMIDEVDAKVRERLPWLIMGVDDVTLEGVVDGVDTAEERKQRIAQSGKPSLLVLDFVGNSGKHKLISTADILGGKCSDDVVERTKQQARQKSEDGYEADMTA